MDLSAFVGMTGLLARWRYQDPLAAPWGWYAQVDNVTLACDAGGFCTGPPVPDPVADGGFEAGSPNPSWSESSLRFPSVICTPSTCGIAGARTGSAWAFLGGSVSLPEIGAVQQSVVLQPTVSTLRFALWVPEASGNGTDRLRVLVDGTTEVFSIGEGETKYRAGYRTVEVNLSGFADGASHVVRLEAITTGLPRNTNFFVDDVSIETCSAISDQPEIAITDVSVPEGDVGTVPAVFVVSLSHPYTAQVTVDFATVNGSATAGTDYTATSGTLTFVVGETSHDVAAQVLGDVAPEGDETFYLDLDNASNATLADTRGVGTILDDELALDLEVNAVDDLDDGACDTVHCSLREAIQAANATGTRDEIRFNMSGAGPFTIVLVSPLPTITSPVVIDGLSQPGADCSSVPPSLLVELNGLSAGTSASGLVLAGGDSEVRGLVINRFDGHGLHLTANGGNLVACNVIGSDASGTAVLGNGGSGVLIDGGPGNNLIGGAGGPTDGCYNDCNRIAFNGDDGITLAASAGSGNRLRGNSVSRNGGLGIDLGGDGVTFNDPGDGDTGVNGLQNFPVITRIVAGPASTVEGVLGGPPNAGFTVELFANTEVNGDPNGLPQLPPFGEGDTLLASFGLVNEADGDVAFSVQVPTDLTGLAVSATATAHPTGNTSEFSAAFTGHITHVLISSFQAFVEGGRTIVEWVTASEAATLGFRLYRYDEAVEDYVPVLGAHVPALEPAPAGATYRVEDAAAGWGEIQRYVLVELLVGGTRALYGPFEVEVGVPPDVEGAGDAQLPARVAISAKRLKKVGNAGVEAAALAGLGAVEGASEAGAGAATAVKVTATVDGLYKVHASEVATALGISTSAAKSKIRNGELKLLVDGQEATWFYVSGGATLYFYGRATTSPYARDNVYRLEQALGTFMASASGGSPVPAPGGSFNSTVHFETDAFAATNAEPDPDIDMWFWKGLSPGTTQTVTLSIDGLDTGGGSAQLVLDLFSFASSADVDQVAELYLNGSLIGEVAWEGRGYRSGSIAFAPSLLLPGANAVEVRSIALPGQGTGTTGFYIDAFDLTYPRFYQAAGDTLLARGDGNPVVTITGFSGSDIEVFNVTDPLSPKRLTGLTIDGSPGPYRVSFDPASATDSYLAVRLSGALTPPAVWGDVPSDWASPLQRADYVVITDQSLQAPASALTAHRQTQGLEVALVLVEDIYDEFNSGLPSPAAIRDFVTYALGQWMLPPSYVVLAGSGTFDYKNVQGMNNNLVPPLLVPTGLGLYSSDGRFADLDLDGEPEAAVGRIPAATATDLQAYVDKLVAYENQVAGSWFSNAVFMADDRDGAADFGIDVLDAESYLATSFVPHTLLLDQLGDAATRQALLDWFGAGMGVLYYLGHGGLGQLAGEALLTTADSPILDDGPLLPLVVGPTCVINRFEMPGFQSLGEALVLDPDGGAIAVWSSSGLSQHGAALRLGRQFLEDGLSAWGTQRLGDAIRQALAAYLEEEGLVDLLSVYNLIGDPATRPPD